MTCSLFGVWCVFVCPIHGQRERMMALDELRKTVKIPRQSYVFRIVVVTLACDTGCIGYCLIL